MAKRRDYPPNPPVNYTDRGRCKECGEATVEGERWCWHCIVTYQDVHERDDLDAGEGR